MRNNDPVISKAILRLLMFGYLSPSYALQTVQAISENSEGGHAAQRTRLLAVVGMLRQSLLLVPYDDYLHKPLADFERSVPPNSLYASWHAQVKAVLSVLPQSSCLEAMQSAYKLPPDPDLLLRHAKQPDIAPAMFFVLVTRLWETGSRKHFIEALSIYLERPYAPLGADLFAFAALGMGDEELLQRCRAKSFAGPFQELLAGHVALASGDTEAAREHYFACLEAEPSQLYLVRLIAALDRPAPRPGILDGRRIGVGFYTWNKFDVTLDTLRSLLASDLGGARVALINNGSTAFSNEDFTAAVQNVAEGYPVELIHLPVNIGAPAARNWLWNLESMREVDYFAYLDDDVFLPREWLTRYMRAMEEYPDATVVGPKGINPGEIPTIQYVARFFDVIGHQKISFSNNVPLFMDMGQFNFAHPSLTVMGCCHLFNRAACRNLGIPDFDLRFSPSQVDDIEHDLQIWKLGGKVIYDGSVGVIHRQHTGKAATKSEAEWGHVWGNHYKMERKFTLKELQLIEERLYAAEAADFRRAFSTVSGRISSPARMYIHMCLHCLEAAAHAG